MKSTTSWGVFLFNWMILRKEMTQMYQFIKTMLIIRLTSDFGLINPLRISSKYQFF